MDNKKKIVFGVLIFALLGMGVFQFTGSSPEPVVAKTEAPAAPEQTKHAPQTDVWLPPLAMRDPFKPGMLANGQPQPEETAQPNVAPKVEPTRDIDTSFPDFPDGLPRTGGPGTGGNVPLPVEGPKFGYTLVGVMLGDTPAAVFADAQGNQKLITLGGEIDGDSKLVALHAGKAIVKFQNQTLTLTIGGTASAK